MSQRVNEPIGEAVAHQGWSHRSDTKSDLVKEVAARVGIPKTHAQTIVDAFLNEIAGSLASGRRVELRGFGVFEAVERASRPAYDMNAGERVEVPKRLAVRFRVGRQLAQVVAEHGDEEVG